jgi:sarcosine oxidase subunit alpha
VGTDLIFDTIIFRRYYSQGETSLQEALMGVVVAMKDACREQSLAAQALHSGRASLTRSFRFHRRRSAFCHRGWCQQCKVRLSDGRNVLACQTKDVPLSSMKVPSGLMRPLALLSERFPPWFHESRFLNPRALRSLYLDLIRRFSAALPVSLSYIDRKSVWKRESCDVLVVGGGLSGLAAGQTYARAGRRVILVEAEKLGGSALDRPELQDQVTRDIAAFTAFGRAIEGALCIGLYEGATRALCVTSHGPMVIEFSELVTATGAYDRHIAVPGNDLPGTIGVRALERLLRQGAIRSNLRLGLYANQAEAARAISAASSAGINFSWIAGPGSLPESDLPSYAHSEIYRMSRKGTGKRIEMTDGRMLSCDLLVTGFSQPTYELQMQFGSTIYFDRPSGSMITNDRDQTRLLVVGEAAGAESPLIAREQATAAATARLAGATDHERQVPSGLAAVTHVQDEAFICLCEDVRIRDVRQAVRDGFNNIELVKRRTGAGTGPCQGKLCHPELLRCMSELECSVNLPTMRPFVRPVSLATFAGSEDE